MPNKLSTYNSLRHTIKTGDAIQWRTNSLLGKLIRWKTVSDVNHTSMAIRFEAFSKSRIFILEALSGGLVLRSLSNRLKAFNGIAYHLPLNNDLEGLRHRIGLVALDYVGAGIKYDYKGCFVGNLFGRAKKDESKMFCSEFWYATIENVLKEADTPDFNQYLKRANDCLNDEAPTPGDIKHLGLTKERRQLLWSSN